MIEYVRTVNTPNYAPETAYLEVSPTDENSGFTRGAVYTTSNGYISKTVTKSAPKYLSLEEKLPGDGKSKLKCLRVYENMLFVTEMDMDPANLRVGSTVAFRNDSNDCAISIGDTGDLAEIFEKLPGDTHAIIRFI